MYFWLVSLSEHFQVCIYITDLIFCSVWLQRHNLLLQWVSLNSAFHSYPVVFVHQTDISCGFSPMSLTSVPSYLFLIVSYLKKKKILGCILQNTFKCLLFPPPTPVQVMDSFLTPVPGVFKFANSWMRYRTIQSWFLSGIKTATFTSWNTGGKEEGVSRLRCHPTLTLWLDHDGILFHNQEPWSKRHGPKLPSCCFIGHYKLYAILRGRCPLDVSSLSFVLQRNKALSKLTLSSAYARLPFFKVLTLIWICDFTETKDLIQRLRNGIVGTLESVCLASQDTDLWMQVHKKE